MLNNSNKKDQNKNSYQEIRKRLSERKVIASTNMLEIRRSRYDKCVCLNSAPGRYVCISYHTYAQACRELWKSTKTKTLNHIPFMYLLFTLSARSEQVKMTSTSVHSSNLASNLVPFLANRQRLKKILKNLFLDVWCLNAFRRPLIYPFNCPSCLVRSFIGYLCKSITLQERRLSLDLTGYP